jgi:hypothetical protein
MVSVMSIVKEVLTIRADNPMVEMMGKQLLAQQAEANAQRERADKLLEKLYEQKKEPETKTDAPTLIKTFFDGFKQLREQAADVLPQGGGRSRLGPWMEFFQPVLPAITDMLKPVAVAIAQQAMQPNPARPAVAGQTPAAQAQEPRQNFEAYLDRLTVHMLHFIDEFDDPAPLFAEWFHDGYPDAQRAIDNIVSMGGAPVLVNWYRTTKHWPQIIATAGSEAEFTAFLNAVIAWKPEPEEPETSEHPPTDATDAPVIDLEEEAN